MSVPALCVTGSPDFVRRIAADRRIRDALQGSLTVANPAELRSHVVSEKPTLLLAEIGLLTSPQERAWLHATLREVRERQGNRLTILLAVTDPQRFAAAGDFLFRDGESLAPSDLIHDLIIAPPSLWHHALTIEEQVANAVQAWRERLEHGPLPTLGSEFWAPALCDPESRDTWLRWVPRYAKYVNENPLIVGPSGSGKTRLAAALHALSGRTGPFVSITPRDFSSPELIQAELFGAAAGAYTGAVDKWGLVKKAEHGTLFIDELQSIDLDLQGKLITFIENKTYRRVGEAESRHADVRFIFATNKPLEELVRTQLLREDFAYRLERLELVMKPLSERRLDIAAGLCFAFGKIHRERRAPDAASARTEGLTQDAYLCLFGAEWPGNLRQLENSVARLCEIASIHKTNLIDETIAQDALKGFLGYKPISREHVFETALKQALEEVRAGSVRKLPEVIDLVNTACRREALAVTNGDRAAAAELVGDHERVLALFQHTHRERNR